MHYIKKQLAGWANYPKATCDLYRPEKIADLKRLKGTNIMRGQGRSYGDAALNSNGGVILSERINRFLEFDKLKGMLKCETGVRLIDILNLIVPQGWFLPVVPGTAIATVGGCIAADVHGKNQHHFGNFSQSLDNFEIITADQQQHKIKCIPTETDESSINEQPIMHELFQCTIGGMGLTGIIRNASLILKRIESAYVINRVKVAANLETMIEFFEAPGLSDDYTVAWLDCISLKKSGRIRGVYFYGHHASPYELDDVSDPFIIPKVSDNHLTRFTPQWLLNPKIMRLYNEQYFSRYENLEESFAVSYDEFFFPLDKIYQWNRLYGKNGFIQYQFVIDTHNATKIIQQILAKFESNNIPVYLAVLKKFQSTHSGLLSFPKKGYTLALDLPRNNPALFTTLDQCDELVIANRGRVYLAKDARLSKTNFQLMYPHYQKWHDLKKKYDPELKFQSDLYSRLFK